MHGKRSGSVPRKTIINDQPHMLAYINPEEAMMLKSMGGAGKPGPVGIPAFYYGGDFGEAVRLAMVCREHFGRCGAVMQFRVCVCV